MSKKEETSKQDENPGTIFPSAADDVAIARQVDKGDPHLDSPAYRLAYDDQEFILRDEMRPVRLLLELSKTELALNAHNINSTVVIFGSARTVEPEEAEKQLSQAQQALQLDPDSQAAKRLCQQAKVRLRHAGYYAQARKLAQQITEQSLLGKMPTLHVITGGGPGIMEAANRGADDCGGVSVGLNIVLPREQRPNPYTPPELCFRFHYFAMRKMHFLMRARALVVFPGGFGTMDELFETLTLVQTKKIKPMPILLFGREYWQRLLNFDVMVEEDMIDADDLNRFRYVESVEEAWDIIESQVTDGVAGV
ncbi:TIGR00730 family Rossman fold protein [Motiliproteus sp. MSK22-1]|uniref:LOG family protein n=1 Tax=Motiliproteus sp. MSK22-1 TaxID=1897630 RepID=UPI00097809B9|nr:TIGR00730 family Rossman fold protein [Motiliproteus sp. MSK22-1]OMH34061.1 Rossman fold protein, TIGR00730 family [Motiliproteus sp. MSK22-1]